MKVAIIGSGYVGLTTGVCLAEIGHQVICLDNNQKKLAKLKQGQSPIFEPGLENLIAKNLKNGKLSFDDNIKSAVKNSEIIFICVNTPPKPDGQADLSFVEAVTKEIALALNHDHKIIVDKSTVPIKTAEKVKETLLHLSVDEAKFDVASNPEFLREGTAVKDTMAPDRIVIGVDSDLARETMLKLYQPIIEKTKTPVKIVSVRSAELIKHGANTFLANKISFANLIAQVCEEADADALEVLSAIGLDERIGNQFLSPGIGFGGSCFPKDITAFKKTLEILGIDNNLIQSIQNINDQAISRFIKKIKKELWDLDGKKIAVLGLAFKANTDDIRNAPVLKIINELKKDKARIIAYDPKAMENTKKIIPDIEYAKDAYEAINQAQALIIGTDWEEFKRLDLHKVKELMIEPIIFDGRNIFDPSLVKTIGFRYFGVGR